MYAEPLPHFCRCVDLLFTLLEGGLSFIDYRKTNRCRAIRLPLLETHLYCRPSSTSSGVCICTNSWRSATRFAATAALILTFPQIALVSGFEDLELGLDNEPVS